MDAKLFFQLRFIKSKILQYSYKDRIAKQIMRYPDVSHFFKEELEDPVLLDALIDSFVKGGYLDKHSRYDKYKSSKKTNELISGFVEYTTYVIENGKRVDVIKKRPKQPFDFDECLHRCIQFTYGIFRDNPFSYRVLLHRVKGELCFGTPSNLPKTVMILVDFLQSEGYTEGTRGSYLFTKKGLKIARGKPLVSFYSLPRLVNMAMHKISGKVGSNSFSLGDYKAILKEIHEIEFFDDSWGVEARSTKVGQYLLDKHYIVETGQGKTKSRIKVKDDKHPLRQFEKYRINSKKWAVAER